VIRRLFGRLRLEQSVTVSSVLVVVFISAVTIAVGHRLIDAALRRGLQAQALSVAHSIGAVATPSLLAYNHPALQAAAESAAEDPELSYVVIHDKEGRVAGLAGHAPPRSDIKPPSGPITRELKPTEARGLDPGVLEVIVPVRVEGVHQPWGAVCVGMRYDRVVSELHQLELFLGLLCVALLVLAVPCARWMSRRITAPLRELAQGTEALARGDMSYRIPVSGALELAELGQAFNVMMDRVAEKAAESIAYQDALGRLNATLEQQVRDRTRALEESVEQYRMLVEQSPDSILIVQEGEVRFVNTSFEKSFGVSEDEALTPGFRVESLFEDESVELVATRIAAWTRGESPGRTEVTARGADGDPRRLELRGSGIEYLGRPAAECLLVDTTEAKRLREKLEDTERLRSLGELAGGVAHDFNNLLSAILGRVQLLRQQEFDAPTDADLEVIEKAALDGRETVLRIQEFSRTRSDRPMSPVNLKEILKDAIEITRLRWKSETEKRNVAIHVTRELHDVPLILGTASELREVFVNLILNSIHALARGGELRLRCGEVEGQVYAEVEDDGEGMSDEVRRRLFDPFFSTKGMGGTGLGMSVAYGIVQRHRGNIEVWSGPGQGTRFVVDFPRAAAASAQAEEPRAEPAAPPAVRARILVIDDEPPIVQLLRDALSLQGHDVVTALSGEEGVRKATTGEFDLVLTDLGMPDMSGWEVVRHIRPSHPDLPIVLVTGWGATISEAEVASAGVAALVHKPFEMQPLFSVISRLLATDGAVATPLRQA